MDKTEEERKAEKLYTNAKNYMNAARVMAERSYCNRLKVGCLIVKNGNIISFGYNGTVPGFENVCETEEGNTSPTVIHAEVNALMKLAASNESSKDAIMFVTTSPCVECAKLIVQAKIKEVIYDLNYRDAHGIEILKRAGIKVTRLYSLKPKDYRDE